MGRSWCSYCEEYLAPFPVDPETLELPVETEAHKYRFNTWRPKSNNFQVGETPEHRFMYTVRTDLLVKGPKGKSYKPRCTCKKWKHSHGFTTRQRAHRLWQEHMAEVDKQETLNLGIL